MLISVAAAPAFAQRLPLRTTGAAGPMTGLRPQTWSAAHTFVTNSTDADADALAVLGFDLTPNVQFARKVWVPAHSRLGAWIPFRAPGFEPGPNKIIQAETILLESAGSDTEHALMREPSAMIGQHDLYDNIVGVLSGNDATDLMAIAARKSIDSNVRREQRNNATVLELNSDHVPSISQSLGALDSLVVGDALAKFDLAQMQNIRQWVLAGGTLWIVGGETDDDHLQMLLGDAWTAREIDRTQLQDFSVLGRHPPVTVQTDDPVELVRVAPGPNMTVIERVNGYPAALQFPLGLGRVFVTELDAKGWVTEQTKPSPALSYLAQMIFTQENVLPTPAAKVDTGFAKLAPAQVGYKIVSRSLVLSVMTGFCLAFLIAGLTLLRSGKMEWFVPAGVLLSVVAAGALLADAGAAHRAVPLTVASAGIVQVFPGQASMRQQSAVAVYNPSGEAGPIESETGGLLWPTEGMPPGRLTRLVFTDRDHWQWQDLTVAAGSMLRGNYTESTDLTQPVSASSQLTEAGSQTHCQTGDFGPLQDVLLAGPNGAMLTHVGSGEAIAASESDLIRNDQYISGSVLTDTQRARQEIYRQLLTGVSSIKEPTLLGFADSTFSGISVQQPLENKDSLLLAMPVDLVAPASGTTFTIPSAFIRFDVVHVQGISTGPFAYSTSQHLWIPTLSGIQPTLQLIQFTLPKALLPIKLDSVTFDMVLRAPGREVTLIRLDSATPATVESAQSPVGVVEAKMTGPDCPVVDSAGRLMLGFTVTALPRDDKRTWDVSDARIIVTGEKVPAADTSPEIRQLPRKAAP